MAQEESDRYIGEGKYEVRFYFDKNQYKSVKTNSWFKFMKLRLTNKVIYYKVMENINKR